ncbi:MAG: putative lactoylglutathione lyase, partial [Maricaulis sp.]
AVNALHARALALGASNAGDPGRRSAHFYGAYFRDLDGHKYLVYCTR